jgi:uncharacterized Tic20 family protein
MPRRKTAVTETLTSSRRLPEQDKTAVILTHLSLVLGLGNSLLGIIGPAIALATSKGNQVRRAEAVKALNFALSMLIYFTIFWLMVLVSAFFEPANAVIYAFGFVLLVLSTGYLIEVIRNTVRAASAKPAHYAVAIRLLKK